MTLADMRRMEIGQIVDFCMEYNEVHGLNESADDDAPKKEKVNRRAATQADWDWFLG